MPSRTSSLKRIEGLYSLIESMHAAALEQTAALVHEAEAAIADQARLKQTARADAQFALNHGDRERWAVAELQREHSDQLQQHLEPILEHRERLTVEARAVYLASRIQRGQIKTVVDKSLAAERIVEERRAQNQADDRFLSRLRWNALAPDPA